MTTLYHGTITENANAIRQDGRLIGPVYLTTRKDVAAEYVLNNDSEGVIFEVDLDDSELNIDRESYDGDDLAEALNLGVSVYTESDVDIRNAKIHEISLED